MHIVSIGEILWDVVDGDERLGGAPFNFAAQSARLGSDVMMVSAVGHDGRGQHALERAGALGVRTELIPKTAKHPTGHVTVTLKDGQPDYVIHRPAAYDDIQLGSAEIEKIADFAPEWVYYGTLQQTDERPRRALDQILEAAPRAKRFYDVNLRKDSYDAELLARLLPKADVLKLSDGEVVEVSGLLGLEADKFTEAALDRFGIETVCITMAEEGSRVIHGTESFRAPGYKVQVADAIGAGDAFAAAFLYGLGQEWALEKTADFANRVGGVIASKSGATPDWSVDEAWGLKAA